MNETNVRELAERIAAKLRQLYCRVHIYAPEYVSSVAEGVATIESEVARLSSLTPTLDLTELKKVLDRDWHNETPEQVIIIAGNGIHWRDIEIAQLKKQLEQAQSVTPTKVTAEMVAAIEHGGYLADSAEQFLKACNDLAIAQDSEEDDAGERDSHNDCFRGLNSAIHNFRKRALAAQSSSLATKGTCQRTDFSHSDFHPQYTEACIKWQPSKDTSLELCAALEVKHGIRREDVAAALAEEYSFVRWEDVTTARKIIWQALVDREFMLKCAESALVTTPSSEDLLGILRLVKDRYGSNLCNCESVKEPDPNCLQTKINRALGVEQPEAPKGE